MSEKLYSLRKSKKIFKNAKDLWMSQRKRLTEKQNTDIYHHLKNLQTALDEKDRKKSDHYSRELEIFSELNMKKTAYEKTRDLVFALVFALVIAIIVRQMWFEFYEIPTGSMRPTLKEQDRLVVSKTDFGINIPLTTKHFYFDPKLVQRGSIFIFTGANMDIHDVDTMYFYLFPGKKQMIKRMMGKPGDSLYFYGGLMYGVDENGNDISSQLQPTNLDKIDHIPFIHFEGKMSNPRMPVQGVFSPIVINQMNEPVARLSILPNNQARGELIINQPGVKEYGDLWGIKNYAMARLLTKTEVRAYTDFDISQLDEGVLYLELQHSPSLKDVQVLRDEYGRVRPAIGLTTSLIPLKEDHVRAIFNNIYTARFNIKNGKGYRIGLPLNYVESNNFFPRFPGVPDGTYEFYYGKAYEVKWQGITSELPPDHPLCKFTPFAAQQLFNVGIELDNHFAPQMPHQRLYPARYSYFRNGDLYLLGAPILKKGDPVLEKFVAEEAVKPNGFKDNGAPLNADGTLDVAFVKQYGLTLPPKSYLALGDNHAMSADSREFGFVPEDNMRGGPDFIFWPPGPRWGVPNQKAYPLLTFPRITVWILAALALGGWWIHHRKKQKLEDPTLKDK